MPVLLQRPARAIHPARRKIPRETEKKRKKIQKKCKKRLTAWRVCGIFILTVATHGGMKA